jgi:sucrose:sucrose fructosyltransferase
MESSRGILIPSTPPLPYAYEPLPSSSFADTNGLEDRRTSGGVRWRAWAVVLAVVALVVAAAVFGANRVDRDAVASTVPATAEHGVLEKTSGAYSATGGFPWSNAMLQWQRTGFHFQPEKNYMNGTY